MRKNFLKLFFIVICMLALNSCNSNTNVVETTINEQNEEIVKTTPIKTEVDKDISINIISTSDTHGKFLPFDYALNTVDTSGSLAQISTVINELRDENTILIDVGDTISGNYSELFINDELHPMVRAQNLMNYDVCVLGNHEFNFGMDVVTDIINQHNSIVLCGNVYNEDETCIASKWTMIEKSGVKIGIIGMVTPNIIRWDKLNIEKAGITVTNPVNEIRKIVNQIKDKVDVIVVACHMDLENEYGLDGSGAYEIADKIPEVDVILAAHGHKRIDGIYRNNAIIIENNDVCKTLNYITLTLTKDDNGKFNLINKKSKSYDIKDYIEDKKISEDSLIIEADRRAKEDANTVIGYLTNECLSPKDEINGIPQAKIQDTALIRLINDVQMYYTGAKISATPLFADNANMYKGSIKKCDTSLIYKHSNTLYKVKMTGHQLKKWMEWSYKYINQFHRGDLTISFNQDIRGYLYDIFGGLKYEVDISKEAGDRITKLTLLDGTPVYMDMTYEVALNNYRANSQILTYGEVFSEEDGLPELIEIDVRGDIGGVRELIRDYIVNVKGIKNDDGIVQFTVEDVDEKNANWKLVGFSYDEAKHQKAVELINSSKLSLKNSQDGRYTNVSSITEEDIDNIAVE